MWHPSLPVPTWSQPPPCACRAEWSEAPLPPRPFYAAILTHPRNQSLSPNLNENLSPIPILSSSLSLGLTLSLTLTQAIRDELERTRDELGRARDRERDAHAREGEAGIHTYVPRSLALSLL